MRLVHMLWQARLCANNPGRDVNGSSQIVLPSLEGICLDIYLEIE